MVAWVNQSFEYFKVAINTYQVQRALELVVLAPHIGVVFNEQINQARVLLLHSVVECWNAVLVLIVNIYSVVFIVADIDHFSDLLKVTLFDESH